MTTEAVAVYVDALKALGADIEQLKAEKAILAERVKKLDVDLIDACERAGIAEEDAGRAWAEVKRWTAAAICPECHNRGELRGGRLVCVAAHCGRNGESLIR